MPPLPWHEVEQSILKEERWLQEVFDFGPYSNEDATPIPQNLSSDKMLRQIAIAIVNGTIQAKEIRSAQENGLWLEQYDETIQSSEISERHGGHWHQSMMGIVKQHFINTRFDVINEPNLSLGRADLGIYKDGYPDLFVEIGTTSLFKTWFNTKTMPDSIFLFIPTTEYAVELKTNKTI